jgi:uncharacterized iron-regulated protein
MAIATVLLHSPALANETSSNRAAKLAKSCAAPGTWINVASGASIERHILFDKLANRRIILLGEEHDVLEHHRWQLQTIAALHGRGDKLVLGFEMFPRHAQPALDRWVKGELTRKAFLKAVKWHEIWGYDPKLYMPLFDFARMNGIPMVALNVDRSLVAHVAKKGAAKVPKAEREGVGMPADASQAYLRSLARTYALKQEMRKAGLKMRGDLSKLNDLPKPDEKKITAILSQHGFRRFVEAQLTWDRAMAEGLAKAHRQHPKATVIGIMGAGHIEHGYGVPHQLQALKVDEAAILFPVDIGKPCQETEIGAATMVFTEKALEEVEAKKPRLGVHITTRNKAAFVNSVRPKSVAAKAGVKKNDLIVRAAGQDIHSALDLIRVVSRQAPGTWLPLTVKRKSGAIDLVAKFAPE